MRNRRYKYVGLTLTAPQPNVRLSRNRLVMATAQPAPDFHSLLETPISWTATDDMDTPWNASVGGHSLAVQMNDFPDESLYTLIVDDDAVANFDDWPAAWNRA